MSIETETYDQVVDILNSDHAPEIEILPSTCAEIQYSNIDNALGLPKRVLVRYFLHARTILFDNDVRLGAGDVLTATSIILLWDPNHTTAINFRKRHLVALRNGQSAELKPTQLQSTLYREFTLLESLLTSPLPKHPKSSALWSHRLWLWTTFKVESPDPLGSRHASDDRDTDLRIRQKGSREKQWQTELLIIFKSADRHPRNYYAWQYARNLFLFLHQDTNSVSSMTTNDNPCTTATSVLEGTIARVQTWCLSHPRDISSWTFLSWLINLMQSDQSKPSEADGLIRVNERSGLKDGVIRDVRQFQERLQWKGASVQWFLDNV